MSSIPSLCLMITAFLSPSASLAEPSTLAWSSFLGGDGIDEATCACLDDAGLPVIAGMTRLGYFPGLTGSLEADAEGASQAFVARFSADGGELLWCRLLGGSGDDTAFALAANGSGGLLVAGVTWSVDFPTSARAFDRTLNGPSDLFLAELDANSGVLRWSSYLGGGGTEMMRASLLVDGAGNPVLAGSTSSVDFPATPGVVGESYGGGVRDAFVTKFAADGSRLLWSSFLGGESSDLGLALTSGPEGELLLAGATRSADFPVTPGAHDTLLGGGGDAFVARLSGDGRRLLWAGFLGGEDGNGHEEITGIAVDAAGNPLLAGVTSSLDFPTTPGAYDRSPGGNLDGFCAMLDASGGRLLWSSLLGGVGDDRIESLSLDRLGRPLLTGSSSSLDYPTTPDAFSRHHAGGETDAVLSRLDAAGSALQWSSFLGGDDDDYAFALASGKGGSCLLAGLAGAGGGKPFPGTPGAYDESHNGLTDAFLCKFALPARIRESGALLQASHVDSRWEIRFCLEKAGSASLRLFDTAGREVRTLMATRHCPAGERKLSWDGRDDRGRALASGIYLARFESTGGTRTRKLVLLR
jgi:hypothetical protein